MRKRVAVMLAVAALATLGGRQASAQAPAGPPGSGHWEGTISVQGKDLKLEVDLASKANTWEGAAGFPDMNAKGLPLSPITVKGQSVTFTVKGAPGDPTFKGTLSKDSRSLAGDFTQGPASGTFMLEWKGEPKLEAPVKNAAVGKDLEGAWEGALDANGVTLRLNLKLANQDGGATGVLISLDQGAAEIPLRVIEQKGAHVKFTVPAVGGSYEGDLKDGQLVGAWSQGPGTLPLTFKRAAK
jgi:hypothetical protein